MMTLSISLFLIKISNSKCAHVFWLHYSAKRLRRTLSNSSDRQFGMTSLKLVTEKKEKTSRQSRTILKVTETRFSNLLFLSRCITQFPFISALQIAFLLRKIKILFSFLLFDNFIVQLQQCFLRVLSVWHFFLLQ